MADQCREMLSQAVSRNCAAVMSLPSAGMLRHHTGRFLAEAEQGVWIESPRDEQPLLSELLSTGAAVAVTFKSGKQRLAFTARLIAVENEYAINSDVRAPAVLLSMPEQVKSLNWRAHYRVRVFNDSPLSARVWRISGVADLAADPAPGSELGARIVDVSLGGLCVIFSGLDGAPPKVCEDDRLRIELRYKNLTMLLEGRMRASSQPELPDKLRAGIKFSPMEGDLLGRRKLSHLTRIFGELQREEVRRTRLTQQA